MEIEENVPRKELPEELWRFIFENIPKKCRKEIPLVNNYFYKIICDIERLQKELFVTLDNVSQTTVSKSF
jgi:hypothetical protein